jgi:hypothetical protein
MKPIIYQSVTVAKGQKSKPVCDSLGLKTNLFYFLLFSLFLLFFYKNYLYYLKKENNKYKYIIYKENPSRGFMPQTLLKLSLNYHKSCFVEHRRCAL